MQDVLRTNLMAQLCEARKALDLTQAELAERIGVSRMTVQRSEQEGADPLLSNFLATALALNLMPKLEAPEAPADRPLPQDLVHRGYAHARTRGNKDDRDRQREAAFAAAWEAVNEHRPVGLSAVMPYLVPNCSQEQASACATVVQWLGSEVGFNFLTLALKNAGYQLTDIATPQN